MSEYDDLWDATVACRNWLEDEKGRNRIDGNCHQNAIWFCEYLRENTDFEPYVRWGAVDYYGANYQSRMDAEDAGAVHFWVECHLDSGWAMTDVFTMRSDEDRLSRGEACIRPDLPDSYMTFPETLYKYTPELEAGLLIGPEIRYLQSVVSPEPPNVFEA